MQSNQIPPKFLIPFGKNAAVGTIRPIPVADQTASSPGAASLTTGFPPATGQPLAGGGIPPSIQDFNGLLNQDTAWAWWQAAGGTVQFDQAFCNAVGGYPVGAVLSSTTAGLMWLNTVDNNTTNPDSTSAANWISFVTSATLIARQIVGGNLFSKNTAGTYTFTVPAGVPIIRVRLWGGGVDGVSGAQNLVPTGGQGYGGINPRAGQFGGVGIAWPVYSGGTVVGTAFAGGVGGAAGIEGSVTVFGINGGIPGANPGDGGSGANSGQVGGPGQAGRVDIYY